ncbi:MAG: type II toxin-antitoxin system VapC family toxin [Candidatus Altiarchaeota archaeon]|nr:type II toxin-antitoxin system VapC family toxin [Candidatus Altiarchaeota archaeon]
MPKAAYFDVSAIIELLKGGRDILSMVETYHNFYTGASVAATILGGEEYMYEKKFIKNKKILGLLDSLEVIPFTEEDAQKTGEIIGKMKASGRDIGLDDAMIAAQCYRKGITLLTNRKSFKTIKNVVNLDLKEI